MPTPSATLRGQADIGFTGQRAESSLGSLMFYGARFYSPAMGRFLSADTIVPEPGNPQAFNRCAYSLSNPVKYVDPTGHKPCDDVDNLGRCITEPSLPPPVPPSPPGGDPASPWQVGLEWLTGFGPRHHEFREGDYFTEFLQEHYHIEDVRTKIANRVKALNYRNGREDYWLGGLEGVPKYFQDYSNVLTFGQTGNLAVTFLGSYELYYYVVEVDRGAGTAVVLFKFENDSTLASATHPPVLGYAPFWLNTVEPLVNSRVPTGPMSKVTQSFWWRETIRFR